MSRLRRFLPPQVADLIVASGSEKQLESHRREITALFCDLRGFTGFTESADAEDVMALLRDYHAAIGEIIIKYSGTLERYAGDGVMVVFNDPVPVENPALQAVLMALEMRDAIGALTEKWRRWGHDIGFGIGIAHGFATLGTIGFEGRFDYAAIGTVSNVASRLCDEAKPGQILISPRVLTKVENAVKVEPVGEFELKGIRRPLAAYNVVGAVSAGAWRALSPEVGLRRPDAPAVALRNSAGSSRPLSATTLAARGAKRVHGLLYVTEVRRLMRESRPAREVDGGTVLFQDVFPVDNTNGTIEAGHGSTVALQDAYIDGGIVTTLKGGLLESEPFGSNSDPSAITGAAIPNAGTIGAEGRPHHYWRRDQWISHVGG